MLVQLVQVTTAIDNVIINNHCFLWKQLNYITSNKIKFFLRSAQQWIDFCLLIISIYVTYQPKPTGNMQW